MEVIENKVLVMGIKRDIYYQIKLVIESSFPKTEITFLGIDADTIKHVEEYNPDLIIVGNDLSVKLQLNFCEKFKMNKILHDVGLMMLIASDHKADILQQAFQKGVDSVLDFPYEDSNLLLQVRTLFKIRKPHNHSKSLPENDSAILTHKDRLIGYIDNVPYGVFLVDGKGRYVDVNIFAERMIGYSRSEILGKHILDYIIPEDIPLAEQHFKAVKEKGEAIVDIRYRRKDGNIRYSTVNAVKLSDNRYLGFKSDITERINYQQNLNKSKERFKSLFEVNPDAVFVWEYVNNDFVLSMVNQAALKITNNRAADFVGMKASEIYSDIPLMISKFHECYKTNKTLDFQHYYKTRYSGEYEWISFKLAYVDEETVILFSETITQRKKAEEELIKAKEEAESREKEYSELVQSLGEGHLKADKNGYVISANTTVTSMFGFQKPDEVLGLHMKQFYACAADREKMLRILKEKGVLQNYELLLKKMDGSHFWTICNIRVIYDDKGEFIGSEGLVRDINELKLAEKALRESEEKYRLIAENTSDGILIQDANNQIVYVSPSYISQFAFQGKSPLNYKPDDIYQKIHPEDRDALFEKIYSAIEKKENDLIYTYRLKKDNDQYIWREDHAKFKYDVNGNYDGVYVICRNVTENKLAEKAMQESEERFKNMFEYHDAPMLIIDPDSGEVLDANNSASVFYGYSRSELCSMMISNINVLSPEQIKVERESAVNNNRNYFIFPHKLANGQIRTVEVHSSPIDFQGKRVLFSIIHDITEREKFQQSLKESENKYRTLIETLQEGIWQINEEGNTTFVNKKMADILGYLPEEMMGRHLFSFMDEHGKNIATKLLENRKSGIHEQHDFEFIKKSGQRTYLLLETVPLYDDKGNYAGSLAAAIDISERKKAEKALQESKTLLLQAEEIADMGSWEWDCENDIAFWSEGLFKIFKLSPEKGAPKLADQSALYSYESFVRLKDAVSECVKNGKPYQIEVQAMRSDGVERTCIAQGRAERDQNGKVRRLWGTFNDITERKLAEAALRDVELAKQTIKFKQNFLANMSHEIRTPLTGVMGMIEALEGTELTDQQKDFISTIKLSGDNLREIIDQVLDYSKIEAGKVTLKPKTFKFRSIPETAKNLFTYSLKNRVTISITVDEKIPQYIYADHNRLSEIVNNLVSNAVKFTREGKIEIRALLMHKNTKKKEVAIKFEVDDTGMGITPEIQKKLFLPFTQAEDYDTIYNEGTGLGLTICKQLANMMQGEIGFESKESGGSIFWFTFKAGIAEASDFKEAAVSDKSKQSSLRVLLAEDKVVNQKVIKLMLTALGHQVTIAGNGNEALELYSSGKFDLILMDIQMPVMNGVSATQMLKEKYTDLPPVIGLSANAFEGDREKYMSLGMDEYLTKPVTKTELDNLIRRVFHP
jgi:PAS domain S-box-containing protein